MKQKNEYTFIGSENTFQSSSYELFEKLVDTYINSIIYWQDFSKSKDESLKEKAHKYWAELAKDFGKFYLNENFLHAENFLKSLIKFEEYDEYRLKPNEWLEKKDINTKEPSEEWIKLGTNELDK